MTGMKYLLSKQISKSRKAIFSSPWKNNRRQSDRSLHNKPQNSEEKMFLLLVYVNFSPVLFLEIIYILL